MLSRLWPALWAVPLLAHELTVETRDPQGLVLASVEVRARHAVSSRIFECTTGAVGACVLSLPLDGEFLIEASTAQLASQSSVNVRGDERLRLTLKVAPLRSSVTVVSASRQEELQEESPIQVDVVTRKQMLSTGYERVSDALSEVPGVLVRRGSTSTVGGEQIQGIDSRQVLVLQDGLPVLGARGIKSGAINLNRQSSGRLSRVEVAKGSGSSTYGTDAIGGVINMITREATEPWQGGFVLSG